MRSEKMYYLNNLNELVINRYKDIKIIIRVHHQQSYKKPDSH